MNNQVILFYRVNNGRPFATINQKATIANLTATFGIKRCDIKYQLVKFFIFCLYFPITGNHHFRFGVIITYKLLVVVGN